jgi:[ribosomal protein S5]-alanine N-acetyltransferase
MEPLDTPRLALRRLTTADAAFILALVNEPSWLRHIGDKGVHDIEGARRYITDGPITMYAARGFGLYLVSRKEDGASIGICGLIKRDTLEDVDIGFAFFPAYWGRGYAREAVMETLAHARRDFGLARVVAIASPDNVASIRLLESVGFAAEGELRLSGDDEVRLFGYST